MAQNKMNIVRDANDQITIQVKDETNNIIFEDMLALANFAKVLAGDLPADSKRGRLGLVSDGKTLAFFVVRNKKHDVVFRGAVSIIDFARLIMGDVDIPVDVFDCVKGDLE